MARRLIDLSVPLQNTVYADPPGHGPAIEYIDHDQSVGDILKFFPGLKKEDLPDGKGWAVERVQLSTHNGTHIDAPWHYHPTMNEGERAATIDEIPLDWCLQPGVKLDFRHFEDGYVATAADVESELKRIGHELKPLEIVVVNTSAGVKYGHPDYVPSGCGMGAEATLYLLKQRRARDGNRRLELGCALCPHRQEIRRDPRRLADLGRPQGRPPHRLLPYREAAQSRNSAFRRLHDLLFPDQDRKGLRRLDARRGHYRTIEEHD